MLEKYAPCPGNCEDDAKLTAVIEAFCPRTGQSWSSASGDNGICGWTADPQSEMAVRTLRAVMNDGADKKRAERQPCSGLVTAAGPPRCKGCADLRKFALVQHGRLEAGTNSAVVAGSHATYRNLQHMQQSDTGNSALTERVMNEAAKAKEQNTAARKLQVANDKMVPLQLDEMSSDDMAKVIRTADTLRKSYIMQLIMWCFSSSKCSLLLMLIVLLIVCSCDGSEKRRLV